VQFVLRLGSVLLENIVHLGVGEGSTVGIGVVDVHHTIEELSHVDHSIIVDINRVEDSLSGVGDRSLHSLSTARVVLITVDSLPLGDDSVAVEIDAVENRFENGGVLAQVRLDESRVDELDPGDLVVSVGVDLVPDGVELILGLGRAIGLSLILLRAHEPLEIGSAEFTVGDLAVAVSVLGSNIVLSLCRRAFSVYSQDILNSEVGGPFGV